MEHTLFNLAFLGYTLATAFYIAYLVTKRETLSRWALWCLGVALTVHVGSLITRTVSARQWYWQQADVLRRAGNLEGAVGVTRAARAYVPWSNWFESFSFFGAVIALVFFLLQWRSPMPILGVFVMPVAWAMVTVAFFSDQSLHQLLPALHSYWMAIHVPVMFTAYAIFANAFGVGLAYLVQERQLKSKKPSELAYRLPSLEQLDTRIYQLILIAFPPLTLGIFLGGVWAYSAWGRFWGWDPKETWALITWFVYVIYLHLRLFAGWRGRKTAYLSLGGFVVVLFTYMGVNYLSELHGFLSGRGR